MSVKNHLWTSSGGSKQGPLLLLIHGLGANATVWNELLPCIKKDWMGGWMTLDLAGHGRSDHCASYSIDGYADDIAALLPRGREIIIIGHSLGGVVAMKLSSRQYDLNIAACICIGVKTQWTEDDFTRGAALAAAPTKTFPTRSSAIERYLKVSGLYGIVNVGSHRAAVGVLQEGGTFRLASDPKINAITALDFPALAANVQAPLHLLCGNNDPVASPEGMKILGGKVTTLRGQGHYPFITDPTAFWGTIQSMA